MKQEIMLETLYQSFLGFGNGVYKLKAKMFSGTTEIRWKRVQEQDQTERQDFYLFSDPVLQFSRLE